MHSVVVLGDVRTHYIRVDSRVEWKNRQLRCRSPLTPIVETILGGAFVVRDVIGQVLAPINDERKEKGEQTVRVFSYAKPEAQTRSTLGEVWNWELFPFWVHGFDAPRPRLRLLGKNKTPFEVPRLERDLRMKLASPSGRFEEPVTGTPDEPPPIVPVLNCPDVVVLDDLNGKFRQVGLLDSTERRQSANSSLRRNLTDSDSDESSRLEQVRLAITCLFERFQIAKAEAKRQRVPIMEPVILASIRGQPDTVLSDDNASAQGRTIWQALHEDPWLRERTVVLLDADDLRDSGLTVSTGLSWERTAQDTIAELQRSVGFRSFLDFGQIIVRYGVTGALHVVRRSATEWSFTLYFDPRRDDATWSVPNRDGVVLGVTSVFLASLVEALTRNCDNRRGNSLIGDLPGTIGSAIRTCIVRTGFLSVTPPNETCWESYIDRITKRGMIPPDVFRRESFAGTSTQWLPIASIPVPPVLLRSWSILSQTAQIRIGRVAQDIVRYGAHAVLNQPVMNESVILDRFFDHLAHEATHSCLALHLQSTTKAIEQTVLIDALRRETLPVVIDRVNRDRVIFGNRPEAKRGHVISEIRGLDALIAQIANAAVVAKRFRPEHAAVKTAVLRRMLDNEDNRSRVAPMIELPRSGDAPGDAIAAPLVEFGRQKGGRIDDPMIIVDRREVEGFRAIQNLMRAHIQSVRDEQNQRPLCIAVFGPPGSGKSTAVKRINESLGDTHTKVLEAYNLTQLTGVESLQNAFDEIANESSGKQVPIAFFDEFDCGFLDNEKPLGWLKFFLAPMEDGLFNKKNVRNAILVFAGGISKTFSEFSLEDRSRTDPQWIDFSKAKGPDFVSRLRGHLDVVGINPADPDDELYLIRRAILIRSLLYRMQNLHDGDEARIDDGMLRAVLNVPEYWHGGRAVRMLLELCRSNDGRISASAVPPIHQLNMLVDGKAFLDLLMNVSSG